MRVTSVLESRPDWYDRNPLSVLSGYTTFAIAPHALTTRWSYTVPSGKKFALQSAQVLCTRDATTATPGNQLADISITPSGGVLAQMLLSWILTGVLGVSCNSVLGGSTVLLAGDAMLGRTVDGSTGGTIAYSVAFEGLEFDA